MSLFEEDNHSALTAIGDQGGIEALALVGTFMQANAEADAKLMRSLYEGLEADRDRWKNRALAAEGQLAAVESRFMAMIFDPPSEHEWGGGA